MNLSEEQFNPGWRILILELLVFGAFLVLAARLVVTNVFSGSYYRNLSSGNLLREEKIPANRGVIFDRNGNPLVINAPVYLSKSCLTDNCDAKVISKEEAMMSTESSVLTVRSYPYGAVFAHVLGYVTPADRKGETGVEAEYDSLLAGRDGKNLYETNAVGAQVRSLGRVDPVPGQDLHLSLDLDLQKVLAENLQNRPTAAVATDPQTGEILALYSGPSFDPNLFTNLSTGAAWRDEAVKALFSDSRQPLFNRAIGGTFPPGSTFKVVVSAAALESGAITGETKIEDTGVLTVGKFTFSNWKWSRGGGTEGLLNIVGAIKRSNDIFFYKAGEATGAETITDWSKKFGLGQKLGIDLPGEATGLVPDKAWREANARDWYLGDTYHLAIGQGDLLVTPLQVNAWTNVVANGGKLCRPQVLLGGKENCRGLGIKPENLALIKEGMVEACSPGGTGWPLFDYTVKGRKIQTACKTGTAEFGDPKDRTHAWFTVFAPAKNPQISLTVLVEAGGEGSDVAAPIAKKALDVWFSDHQ